MKDKILEFYKNNKYNFLVYCICFIFVLGLFILPSNIISSKPNNGGLYPAPIIEKDVVYTQFFDARVNNLQKIGIKFSTYGVENKKGILHLKFSDNANNVVKEEDVELIKLEDNNTYYLSFNPIKNSKGKRYRIEFNYKKYYEDDSLTYWFDSKTKKDKFGLRKNDAESSEVLHFEEVGNRRDYFLLFYILIIVIIDSIMILLKGGKNYEEK